MADDSAALIERLEAWAAKERHNARHVSGPAFHPPWGQDIIDRHNQNAADLTLALSLLADRARMEKAIELLAEVYEAARDVSMAAVQDDDGEWSIKGDPEAMLGRLYLATEEVRKVTKGASQ